jgi:soluble cytochrome b562
MTIEEAKKHINRLVNYQGAPDLYKLTACILRKNKQGYYYSAEIQDIKNGNSVLIVSLDDISTADKML